MHNLSPWAAFSFSPLGGRGQGEGARVFYPKQSQVNNLFRTTCWVFRKRYWRSGGDEGGGAGGEDLAEASLEVGGEEGA